MIGKGCMKVAILGCGTVEGSGVYEIITNGRWRSKEYRE